MSSPVPTKDPRLENPYADTTPAYAPQAPQQYMQPSAQYPVGIWARGPLMVFHKSAVFPDVCLKSGQPTEGSRFKQKLSWFPPWISVTILAGLLIYVILAAILTKTAQIDVGLLPKYKQRRRMHIGIGIGLLLLSIVAIIGGIVVADANESAGVFMAIAGVVTFFGSLIYLAIAPRMFRIHKITDHYVYLKGIHPDVMRQLQPCPFNYDV